MWLGALIACAPGTATVEGEHPTGETPTAPTSLPPPEPSSSVEILAASCDLDPDNVLRARCAVTLSEPAVASVELTDGVETATFTASEAAIDPVVAVWGLSADATWHYTVRAGGSSLAGDLATGALPEAFDVASNASGSGPSEIVDFAVPFGCDSSGLLTVFDGAGRVRWYQDFGGAFLSMYQVTDAGTMLAMIGKKSIAERDVMGNVLLERTEFDLPIHHDISRRNDKIYLLEADDYLEPDGVTYVEDRVVALDRDGNDLWTWDEHGHLDATLSRGFPDDFWDLEFPGASDAWHTNGFFVDENEDVIVSSYLESELFKVDAATGEIEWFLAGNGVGKAFPTDIALVDDGTGDAFFGIQHQPRLLANGHLTVFDNLDDRALELDLDQEGRTATFVEDWPGGGDCPVQSSIFELDGGHHLVACGKAHLVTEFDATGTVVGSYPLSCPNGDTGIVITRAQPFDLWSMSAEGTSASR